MKRVFLIGVLFCFFLYAGWVEHEQRGDGLLSRPVVGEDQQRVCKVEPDSLVKLAQGESLKPEPVLDYLTVRSCRMLEKKMPEVILQNPIPFSREPIPLNVYYRWLRNESRVESVASVLEKRVSQSGIIWPKVSERESIAFLTQVSLLSRKAGQELLAKRSIYELLKAPDTVEGMVVSELAKRLVKWRLDSPQIAPYFSKVVEDLFILSEASAFKKVLVKLSLASQVEKALVSVLNQSIERVKGGVSQGAQVSSEMVRSLVAVLLSTNISFSGHEVSRQLLGEIFERLFEGEKLVLGASFLYSKLLKRLALEKGQEALAKLLSQTLSYGVVFFPEDRREQLLLAAWNYPFLKKKLFRVLMGAWYSLDPKMLKQKRELLRQKYFIPYVVGILEIASREGDRGLGFISFLHFVVSNQFLPLQKVQSHFSVHVLPIYYSWYGKGEEERELSLSSFLKKMVVGFYLADSFIPFFQRWLDKEVQSRSISSSKKD